MVGELYLNKAVTKKEDTKGEIKIFSDEGKLRAFVASRSTIKEWLRLFLKQKGNNKRGTLEHQKRTM